MIYAPYKVFDKQLDMWYKGDIRFERFGDRWFGKSPLRSAIYKSVLFSTILHNTPLLGQILKISVRFNCG